MRPTLAATAAVGLSLAQVANCKYTFTEPDDLKGVLNDEIVPTWDECKALCDENEFCLYAMYHYKCDECWQLDCSLGDRVQDSSKVAEYKKLGSGEFFYCDDNQRPKIPEGGCSNLTATATITGSGGMAETAAADGDEDVAGSARATLLEVAAACISVIVILTSF